MSRFSSSRVSTWGAPRTLPARSEALDADLDCVLVLGHNPGWEKTVEWLCGRHVILKTANAALVAGTGASWREALDHAGTWELCEVLRAHEL